MKRNISSNVSLNYKTPMSIYKAGIKEASVNWDNKEFNLRKEYTLKIWTS
ncbi:hypothetical protein [Desulfurella amilsii]|nr:hypothetical protein [Desulfurella amilsii]